MNANLPLRIGITCYPSVGGSGVLASALGEQLALRGHDVHFIAYERPFRLPFDTERIHFHSVQINDYELFRYPDYTLPLSVKMAEVSRDAALDVLHVHYAVPHATAAILARAMLPAHEQPKVVTTLHGTDTTLLARDPGYGPAIQHALGCSDAVTAVSDYLARETHRYLKIDRAIEVIHNFYTPSAPRRSAAEMRSELKLADGELLLIHISNLRPVKRVDLLLQAVARVNPTIRFKLLILAGESFSPFQKIVNDLGLAGRVIIREKVNEIEEYLQISDVGLVSSEIESFCLSILECMCFSCPSVASAVGGIPEVIEEGVSGRLVPFGDVYAMAKAIEELLANPTVRKSLGQTARQRAAERFSASMIVSKYESLYRRVCAKPAARV